MKRRLIKPDHTAPRRRYFAHVGAVVTVAAALAAAGCGSSHNTSTSTSTSGANSAPSSAGSSTSSGASTPAGVKTAQAATQQLEAAVTSIGKGAPLPKRPPTGKSVIFLLNAVPSDTEASQGFQAAAKALGWSYSTLSYDSANPATFNTALSNALAKHPSFVSEAGTPTELISPSVMKAYQASSTKLVIDGVTPCQTNSVLIGCVADADNFERHGVAIADWFVADSDGKGQAIVQGTPGYPVLAAEMSAFTAQVKKLCPGCQLKQINATLPQVESGQVVPGVVSALKSNPSYKYLIFSIGDFATGINSALNAASLSGIKIAGFGVTPVTAAALRSGTQSMWTGVSYYQSGYRLADAAARYSVGASSSDTDSIQPLQLLTKTNVGSTSTWNEPTDALAQFEKLWKVPVTSCTLGCS